ncbi:hypothetical protein HYU09_05200 [Candidatus Woesearchaeota archaeon]|nr:hypothetical protein [Candidatus Woesearchaeota archaeon]
MDFKNFRKIISNVISILVIMFLSYLTYTTDTTELIISYVFFIIILILVISTDFKILKFGIFSKFYFWIETPELIQNKKQSFEALLLDFKNNYYTKKYCVETSAKELRVLKMIEDDVAIVDSRDIFSSLKNGLKFNIFFKKDIEAEGEDFFINSDSMGIGTIIYVGKFSKLKIEWYSKEKSSNKKLFAEILVDENIKESELDDIKRAYDSLRKVSEGKWRID